MSNMVLNEANKCLAETTKIYTGLVKDYEKKMKELKEIELERDNYYNIVMKQTDEIIDLKDKIDALKYSLNQYIQENRELRNINRMHQEYNGRLQREINKCNTTNTETKK